MIMGGNGMEEWGIQTLKNAEELLYNKGFTSFPNIFLKYAPVLELDFYDLGVLLALFHLKSNGKEPTFASNPEEQELFRESIRRGKKLKLIHVEDEEKMIFNFSPLLAKITRLWENETGKNFSNEVFVENLLTQAQRKLTEIQQELIDKEKQITQLEKKLGEFIQKQGNPKNACNITNVFRFMENALGRPVSPRELEDVTTWHQKYEISEEAIILLLQDCYSRGYKNISYLNRVAQSWFDKGVKTREDAERAINQHKQVFAFYGELMKYLSFDRLLTVPEMETVDKWTKDWGFSREVILKACDLSINCRKPTIGTIDRTLRNWYQKGAKKIEEVQQLIAANNQLDSKQNRSSQMGRSKEQGQLREEFRKYDELSRTKGIGGNTSR